MNKNLLLALSLLVVTVQVYAMRISRFSSARLTFNMGPARRPIIIHVTRPMVPVRNSASQKPDMRKFVTNLIENRDTKTITEFAAKYQSPEFKEMLLEKREKIQHLLEYNRIEHIKYMFEKATGKIPARTGFESLAELQSHCKATYGPGALLRKNAELNKELNKINHVIMLVDMAEIAQIKTEIEKMIEERFK